MKHNIRIQCTTKIKVSSVSEPTLTVTLTIEPTPPLPWLAPKSPPPPTRVHDMNCLIPTLINILTSPEVQILLLSMLRSWEGGALSAGRQQLPYPGHSARGRPAVQTPHTPPHCSMWVAPSVASCCCCEARPTVNLDFPRSYHRR